MFAKVPEPKVAENRMHLDLMAPDPEAAVTRLAELGGTRIADREEHGYTWRSWPIARATSSVSPRPAERWPHTWRFALRSEPKVASPRSSAGFADNLNQISSTGTAQSDEPTQGGTGDGSYAEPDTNEHCHHREVGGDARSQCRGGASRGHGPRPGGDAGPTTRAAGLREATAGRLASGPYRITASGRDIYRTWLTERLPGDTVRVPLLLAVAFGSVLPERQVAALLRRSAQEHRNRLDSYRALAADLDELGLDVWTKSTLSFGVHYEEAVLRWFDALPDEVAHLVDAAEVADHDSGASTT